MGQHRRGATTTEFLIDQQDAPYFLEVNPYIQVEHAITEGIARARGQPVISSSYNNASRRGERLNFRQMDIAFVGDVMEVRLNARH